MSPMAVTGSIFNHVEISAGGSAASKELERKRRKGERKKDTVKEREREE